MAPAIVTKSDFLNTYISQTHAERSYQKCKDILPPKPSKSLAKTVGCLMTDGYLDVRPRDKSIQYSYIGYFSKYDTELIKFNNHFSKVFNAKGKIREWGVRKTGTSKGCIILNAQACRILTLTGVPPGDKTKSKYSIPSWVLNSKPLQVEFLRTIFDCEGSIGKDKGTHSWAIRYSMYKQEPLSDNTIDFLNTIRDMLFQFGVTTSKPYITDTYTRTKDNQKMVGYVIKIRRKDSIISFHKNIGFEIPYKQKRLKKAIKEFLS